MSTSSTSTARERAAEGGAVRAPRSPDDRELAARIGEGDPDAVSTAYRAHHAALRRFALRLVGDPDVAEDLVHDVFVGLPRTIRGYRGDSALSSFLFGVAVNHARHHMRSSQRRRAAGERMAREPEPTNECPEHEVTRRQLAAALARAMDSLSFDHRTAFVLCEVEGQSSIEAGALLGIPEGTVRTRLFHARRLLREALAKEGVR